MTGIRSNSSTIDDVVITASYLSGGVTSATLYAGPLNAVPTAPLSNWNIFTPNFTGQMVTGSIFYGPNTNLFDPSLGVGNVRVVGSYKYSNNANPNFDHGMIYQGPVAGCPGGSSSCWTQIDPTSLVKPGEMLENTIAHSTMGRLVVGDWDTNLAVGHAFVYNMGTASFADLNPNGSLSVTAYGIWQNGNGSYTIAGGLSAIKNDGVDEGWLADYDAATMSLTHLKTFEFDNQPLTSLVSHFDGITGTANGYNLTGEFLTAGGNVGGFFASVSRLPDGSFGEANWTPINFAYPGFTNVVLTTGNTVLGNDVLGIFTDVSSGQPVTLSYLASVPTPEPGTLSMVGFGLGMLGLIGRRLRA